MKKYLLILVAAIALVSCEDSFESERELESYTLEELNTLSEGFNYRNVGFENMTPDFEIMRGGIYGAVKYDNQWRACLIGTK